MSRPPATLANLMLDGQWPFAYPPALAASVSAILKGEWDYAPLPDNPHPRRMLDIGAGCGAFACWAFKRYAGEVFIECYEPHPELAKLCAVNAPPGSRTHAVAVTSRPSPVKLRDALDWERASFESSGQIEVPTLHPRDLPPTDVLKCDARGDLDVLSNYQHLATTQIVMLRWRREGERAAMEKLCADAGLRLFKSTHMHVSSGLQVWIRSRAVWNAERYVMP
jgi:hypothetical protein